MSDPPSTELNRPLFARLYRGSRQAARDRGEDEHRRRLLAGLRGWVVDVGAGDGANFGLYPPEVDEVVAVEPERHLRAYAEEAAKDASVTVRVVPGLAGSLPLDDESADAAVASLVLCTVPDPGAALTDLRRILRPGGELRFYEHVHAHEQPLRALLEVADRTKLWPCIAGGCHPTRETGEAIEAAGFRIERCERFGFKPCATLPRLPHLLGIARRA